MASLGTGREASVRGYPYDAKAALRPLLRQHFDGERVHNLSAARVVAALEQSGLASDDRTTRRAPTATSSQRPFGGRRLVWFGEVPSPMRPSLQAGASQLYASEWDWKQGLQYVWLSSPGMRTHTHFDNDRNFFVQVR